MNLPRLPQPLGTSKPLLCGVVAAVAGIALAAGTGDENESCDSPQGPVVAGALPLVQKLGAGAPMFSSGGLGLLETSTYFDGSWYFDPAHSMPGDIADIDLSGQLAKGWEAGTLWETGGIVPRPAGRGRASTNAVRKAAADSQAPAHHPIVAVLSALGLVALLVRIVAFPADYRRRLANYALERAVKTTIARGPLKISQAPRGESECRS